MVSVRRAGGNNKWTVIERLGERASRALASCEAGAWLAGAPVAPVPAQEDPFTEAHWREDRAAMRFKDDLDKRVTEWGQRFSLYSGCCRDRKVNERGWCRTCGTVIAERERHDAGIPSIMRMERGRVAAIRPRWTPPPVTLTQAPLLLSEQDRHADPSGAEMGAGADPLTVWEEREERVRGWRR